MTNKTDITVFHSGTTRIVGHEAIAFARANGLSLHKHQDPFEGARLYISPDDADDVARSDASLIYLDWSNVWDSWEPIDGEAAYCTSRVCEHPDLEEWAQVGEIGDRRATVYWIEVGEPDWDEVCDPDRIEFAETD